MNTSATKKIKLSKVTNLAFFWVDLPFALSALLGPWRGSGATFFARLLPPSFAVAVSLTGFLLQQTKCIFTVVILIIIFICRIFYIFGDSSELHKKMKNKEKQSMQHVWILKKSNTRHTFFFFFFLEDFFGFRSKSEPELIGDKLLDRRLLFLLLERSLEGFLLFDFDLDTS